jgi:excisionase family DNA binding protein
MANSNTYSPPVVDQCSAGFPIPPILMQTQTVSPWLTSREAANHLRVEHRTVLQWARQGKLKGYVLSGTRRITWRFLKADLDAKLLAPTVALNGRIQ